VRRVAPDGTVSTFAGDGTPDFGGDGGAATAAHLRFPSGVSVARDGGVLIADTGNNRIRRVAPSGIITTVAGDGTAGFSGDGGAATAARLDTPFGVAAAPDGGVLIADNENHRIRRVSPSGTIVTVAGTGTLGYSGDGGPATSSALAFPMSVTVAPDGSILVADMYNHRIRRIRPAGRIDTLAGTSTAGFSGDGALATTAQLTSPMGVAATPDGDVLIADSSNHRVRRVDADLTAPTPAQPTSPVTPAPAATPPAPSQAGHSALSVRIGSLRRTGRTVTLRYKLSAPAQIAVKLSGVKAIKRSAKAGDNTLRFKLPKRLKAGRRTLVLSAHSADGRTATATARLTVKNATSRG
jgi:streptogramin lyase